MTPTTASIRKAFSGGVYTPFALIELCGDDLVRATLFAQILYWLDRATIERDGHMWIAKANSDWYDELRIPETTARTKIRQLKAMGVIVTEVHKFGAETRVHIRVDEDGFAAAWARHVAEDPGTSDLDSPGSGTSDSDSRGTSDLDDPFPTESTTEITSTDNDLVDFVDDGDRAPSSRSVETEPARSTELVRTEPPPPTPPAEPDEGPKGPIVRRIFDLWVEVMGKDVKRVKLNAARRRKIEARLNEGYTEEDLCDAVRGVTRSSYHMGENRQNTLYNDFPTIFRDGSQVEKFAALEREGRTEGKVDVFQRLYDAGMDPEQELGTDGLFGGRR